MQAVSLRIRQGLVNALSDLLTSLGHQLQIFMPELTAVLLRFALASSFALDAQVCASFDHRLPFVGVGIVTLATCRCLSFYVCLDKLKLCSIVIIVAAVECGSLTDIL